MTTMVDGNIGGGASEESRLLASPPPPASAYAIFNDLTYSDDDESDWELAELGIIKSGSISSPETAALLDEIQNAMFPIQQQTGQTQQQGATTAATIAQQQQQQQPQPHLMHPLARHESLQSSDGDENSYLAYSITSTLGDDYESSKQAQQAAAAAGAPTNHMLANNYGSLDAAGLCCGADLKSKLTAPPVTFRPPTSVFDHSSSRSSSKQQTTSTTKPVVLRPPASVLQKQYRRQNTPPKTAKLRPRPRTSNQMVPQLTTASGTYGKLNTSGCFPITPLPSMSSESPVTSATATDTTLSPNGDTKDAREDDEDARPREKERITRLLSEEATKRLRRHRRLKRIKKAAEAREAAVQKVKGTEQSGRCNDAIFAFIFLCQFLLVSMSALAFGPGALRDKIYGELIEGGKTIGEDGSEAVTPVDYNPFAGLQTDDIVIIDNPLTTRGERGSTYHNIMGKETLEEEMIDGISHIDYINVIQLVCIASGYASLCVLLALGFMMNLSKNYIHITLIFTICVTAAWTVLGLAFSGYWIIPISGAVAFVMSVAYTIVVWDRISFAATNLSVALKGMRSTLDVPFVGLCVLATTILWTVWWICAFIGTFDFLNDDEELSNDWMSVVVMFFVFSYYWTFQVIKGISQTIVASIIGKWWDMSEDDPLPLCSSVLHSSLSTNIISSFGSICLGSIIVNPCIFISRISTFGRLAKPKLRKLKETASPKLRKLNGKSSPKPSSRDPAISPDVKCSTNVADGCLPDAPDSNGNSILSRHVNQWSFTYIGLYGYKFWDSGSKASQLFEARGWTHVVSDDLIMTVMTMTSLIVGASTACLGLIVEEVDGYSFTSLNKPIATAFLIGLLIGFFLSSAFLSIIEGSVSAILVCYAAAPVDFHANHHNLSEEMKSAWKHFWLQKPPR